MCSSDLLKAAFDWLLSAGKPLLVGIPILAVLLAAIGFFVVDWAWRLGVRWQWRQRQRRRRCQSQGQSNRSKGLGA